MEGTILQMETFEQKSNYMKSPLLILDVSFLAYRAVFTTGGLQHEGNATDVLFGLMRDLIVWQEMFRTKRVAFCFDCGRNKRLDIYPEYKKNRMALTEEEKRIRKGVHEQLDRLREEELYQLGFRNVFWQDGYEADDVIASVVLNMPEGEEAMIVASDGDLYQLLSGTVQMYDPVRNKIRSLQWFHSTYGIIPSQWADVKAVCGCSSDNVKGVRSVGEKSALLFLRGLLKTESIKFKRITESTETWKQNLRLVQLPFAGTKQFLVREDKVTKERWRKVCESKGMKTLKMAYV